MTVGIVVVLLVAWICIPGLEASGTGGLLVVVVGGTDDDRWSAAPFAAEPAPNCPDVDANLFVKLEIAQPAHDVSPAGVPMRGAVAPPAVRPGDGSTVSGMEAANFRMRAK